MAGRSTQQMTLRELVTESERLSRELEDHLVQSLLPRIKNLRRVTSSFASPVDRDQIPDSTVRTTATSLLESDAFARQLFDTLQEHLKAAEQAGQRIAQSG